MIAGQLQRRESSGAALTVIGKLVCGWTETPGAVRVSADPDQALPLQDDCGGRVNLKFIYWSLQSCHD